MEEPTDKINQLEKRIAEQERFNAMLKEVILEKILISNDDSNNKVFIFEYK